MTQRNRHLLEAFKASGATGSGTPTPAQSPAPPAAVGAPAPSPLRVSLTDTRPARSVVLLRSQLQLLGVVVVLALACAFLLGRASVRIAAASGPSGTVGDNTGAIEQPAGGQPVTAALQPPSNAIGAPRPDVDRTARTPAELALIDPRNVWTIKLVDYKNTEYEQGLARDTFNYLTQQGLQASLITNATRTFIVVGAAPAQVDLDHLLQSCKTMKGLPPRSKVGDFESAYCVKIDQVYKRDQ